MKTLRQQRKTWDAAKWRAASFRLNVAANNLVFARKMLREAGAVQALKRINALLKSVDGARRHADLQAFSAGERAQREAA